MAWNPYQNYYNPYYPQGSFQQPINTPALQPQQIVRVNGSAGANALQLGPNSSVIVADETDGNRLFLCMTDGAGFKTVRPIRATFEDVEPPVQDSKIQALEKRIADLEAMVHDRINPASIKSEYAIP